MRIGLLICFLLALCSGVTATTKTSTADRPNILFIYTDDQSHRTVSCYPEAYKWANTPNIDALATDVVPTDPAVLYKTAGVPWWISLLDGRHKYIRTLVKGEVEELYDLDNDPQELVNLAMNPAYREQLKSLRASMIAELDRTGAGLVENLPPTATK